MKCILFGHVEREHPLGDGRTVVICAECGKTMRAPANVESVDATPKRSGYMAASDDHFERRDRGR